MVWCITGILTAFFFSLTHIISKYIADRTDPFYLSNTVWMLYSIIVFPFVIIFWPELVINIKVFFGLILIGIISFSTQVIFFKSLKQGTVSKTVPLLSITPLFTLIIALLWLKEFPKLTGVSGIILIVFGTYILNINHFRRDQFFEPLFAIFKVNAYRLMLMVALAYGFGSVLDKFVVNHSNVISRVFIFSYFSVFFNTVYLILKDKKDFFYKTKHVLRFWKTILLFDIFYLLMLLLQMYSLTLTHTAYVISLKRTAALFSVIMAYFIFGEKKYIWSTLSGTFLMVIGAVFIML